MSTVSSSPGEPQALLDIQDLMRRWKTSEATIRRQVAAGRLPKIKVGKLVRFSPEDVAIYEMIRRSDPNSTPFAGPASLQPKRGLQLDVQPLPFVPQQPENDRGSARG